MFNLRASLFLSLLLIAGTALAEVRDLGLRSLPDGFQEGGHIRVSTLSRADALKLLALFKADERIPFDYGFDGCTHRAQLMTSIARKNGIEMGKVYVDGSLFADNSKSKLKPKMLDDVYSWRHHVATVVYVEDKGKIEPMILDPALSDLPLSRPEFEKAVSHRGAPTWPDGQEKPPAEIKNLYYGSRHQFEIRAGYPAKMSSAISSERLDRLAAVRLRNIDYQQRPGSVFLRVTEEEYCQKYGIMYCKDEAEGKRRAEARRARDDEELRGPHQECEGEAEPVPGKTSKATLADGFSDKGRIEVSVLSESEATKLFAKLKADKRIDFSDYDGCHNRAHLMLESARQSGVELGKVFFEGQLTPKNKSGKGFLGLPATHHDWVMHVAPVAVVRAKDGKLKKMVLDPSLHDGPVELTVYRKQLLDKSSKRTPRIDTMYCTDRYQLDAKKDLDVKIPPHDMSKVTENILAKMTERRQMMEKATKQFEAAKVQKTEAAEEARP